MAQRIRNMTQGSPLRLIITFALPLMAGNVFQQLYTVVDTAVVGQVVGVGALASLGAADWLNWMVLGIIQGLTQGFSILMAQNFGAEDHRGLSRSIGTSVTPVSYTHLDVYKRQAKEISISSSTSSAEKAPTVTMSRSRMAFQEKVRPT